MVTFFPLLGPLLTGQVLGFGADDADVLKILGAVGGAGPDGGFVFPAVLLVPWLPSSLVGMDEMLNNCPTPTALLQ